MALKGVTTLILNVTTLILNKLRDIGMVTLILTICSLLVWGCWMGLKQFSAPVRVGSTLVAAGVLILFFLWRVPQWQASAVIGPRSKARFDIENEARKTLAQIIGGFLLLSGFYASWQNITLSRQGQITDRFTKAIEQLGAADSNKNMKLEIRLGGIYALERIADESPKDHWAVFEVLTTYIRENAPRKEGCMRIADRDHGRGRVPADIQTIMTVIGRRDTSQESAANNEVPHIDHADLSGGVNIKNARLDGAYLSGADLSESDLRAAHLNGAFLTGACLVDTNFRGADLRNAHFGGADLHGANFGVDYNNGNKPTDLSGADLEQSQIDDADGDKTTVLPSGIHRPEKWKWLLKLKPMD